MAAVYKAYQPSVDRYVAIKVLPRQFATDPQFVARFQQEVRMLAHLQHPHILPVFDSGQSNGYTYLVMPFVEAGTVAGLLRGHPLPGPQLISIITQVADALDYAHQKGLIHRDIKPSNILIDEHGNCLLSDFGLAKILETTNQLTGTGGILGTPLYMSPEQGRGEPLDTRSDIYSLGVVLYELATGRVPFRAETPVAVIYKHVNDPLPAPRGVNPSLPVRVEQVILKALAKRPQDRFGTARQLSQALEAAYAPISTLMPPGPPTGPSKTVSGLSASGRPRVSNRLLAMASLLVVGCLAAGVFVLASGIQLICRQQQLSFAPTPTTASEMTPTEPAQPTAERTATAIVTPTPAATAGAGPTDSAPTVAATSTPATRSVGGRIAFYSTRAGSADLYLMDENGNQLQQLTSSAADERVPSWSPTGDLLAYYSDADGDYEIYILQLSTGQTRQITFNTCGDFTPQWSPQGDELIYYSDCDGNREIYRIRTDGSGSQQLTFTSDVYNWFPAWSPDGRQIVFASNRSGRYLVYEMNSDGSDLRAITAGCIPAWSPDGEHLVYVSRCDGTGDIWLAASDGQQAMQLTNDPSGDTSPSWAPDGSEIVFSSSRSGGADINAMALDGTILRQLTDDPAEILRRSGTNPPGPART